MEPVVLRTTRLELSAPVEDDVDAIHEACQDAGIQRYTTVPSPYRRNHAAEFVEKAAGWWRDGVECTWAIRTPQELVGMIGLHRIAAGSAEIGYWLARPARGRGHLAEAARAVVDWGFSPDGLALERIEWRAVVGNEPSARSAQRLGFRYEGLLRQALAGADGRDDAWIAGLLAGDEQTAAPWPVLEG